VDVMAWFACSFLLSILSCPLCRVQGGGEEEKKVEARDVDNAASQGVCRSTKMQAQLLVQLLVVCGVVLLLDCEASGAVERRRVYPRPIRQ
jgi:hypothetical protein